MKALEIVKLLFVFGSVGFRDLCFLNGHAIDSLMVLVILFNMILDVQCR